MKRLLLLILAFPLAAQANLGSGATISASAQKNVDALEQALGAQLTDEDLAVIVKADAQNRRASFVASAELGAKAERQLVKHYLGCVGLNGQYGVSATGYLCADLGNLYVIGQLGVGPGMAASVRLGAVVVQAPEGEDFTGTYIGGGGNVADMVGFSGDVFIKNVGKSNDPRDVRLDRDDILGIGTIEGGYGGSLAGSVMVIQHFSISFDFSFGIKTW